MAADPAGPAVGLSRKACVTGGAGFIGSHVCELLLERGWQVTVLDDLSTGCRENVPAGADLVVTDLVNYGAESEVARSGPDVVFHLAAQTDVPSSVTDPVSDAEANIIATLRVIEGARRCGARVVYASSGGSVYGECGHLDGLEYVIVPASESDNVDPLSPYAVSKLAGETYLRISAPGSVILRYANVYGPRQSATLEGGVVARFVDRILVGEPVTVYGTGFQTRDYVYVADVAWATVEAANFPAGTYNVSTGTATTVRDLLDAVASELGVTSDVRFEAPRKGDLHGSCLSPDLLRSLTLRQPVPLAVGLAETAEWARRRIQA